jgi:hypothetical protein
MFAGTAPPRVEQINDILPCRGEEHGRILTNLGIARPKYEDFLTARAPNRIFALQFELTRICE